MLVIIRLLLYYLLFYAVDIFHIFRKTLAVFLGSSTQPVGLFCVLVRQTHLVLQQLDVRQTDWFTTASQRLHQLVTIVSKRYGNVAVKP